MRDFCGQPTAADLASIHRQVLEKIGNPGDCAEWKEYMFGRGHGTVLWSYDPSTQEYKPIVCRDSSPIGF